MPTHSRLGRLALTALVIAALPAAAGAQSSEPFNWSGAVASGGWLQLRNVNGSVRVEAASGSQLQVEATKRWRRGDPRNVRIEVKRYDGDRNVLVCAVWGEQECDERGYHGRSGDGNRNNDVSVDFVVRVPRGVNVETSTVNGGVRVAALSGEIRAETVNGDVEAESSGGPVTAQTVNGDVRARMGRFGGRDLDFETVNGSVTISLPAQLDADVELETVNGHLDADYPLTVSGRMSPRHLRATIGRGGPKLRVSTVNGSVTLRKEGA